MGFRLQRRVTIAPGLTMNISKRGVGMSVGPRGAKVSVGPRGARESIGIPGTGMRYEVRQDRTHSAPRMPAAGHAAPKEYSPSAPPVAGVGFFGKAFKAPFEKEFIEGAQCMWDGDRPAALGHFERSIAMNPSCVDADLLASLMLIDLKNYDEAARRLATVVSSPGAQFVLINKYLGSDIVHFEVPITDQVNATLRFDMRAAYLLLAEVYQQQGTLEDAVSTMRHAIGAGYRDPIVVLSLAELYNELEMDDELIAIGQGTENIDNVSVAIMFYLGQAMMRKGYYDAAVTVLKAALTRRKDRDEGLLLETRYVLAQVYEASGKKAMARKQYEQVYAKDAGFRDVRQKLESDAPERLS